MAELHGEKIDIVDWSDDPAEFVGHALSPARVSLGHRRRRRGACRAGRRARLPALPRDRPEGQNARLAARLTGWRIDIVSDTAPADRHAGPSRPAERRPTDPAVGAAERDRVDRLTG